MTVNWVLVKKNVLIIVVEQLLKGKTTIKRHNYEKSKCDWFYIITNKE